MNVSVLILTLNEAKNIAKCLDSLKWCDDIVILDSYSKDATIEIAKSYDCRVVQRKFDNYARQRNFGLNEITYKNPWILMLDADERVTPELADEIEYTLKNTSDDICLYRVRGKYYFMGKWIRRSSGYPTWFGRLIRIGKVSVQRFINEEIVTEGKVGFLQEHFLHYPFNKGLHAWIEKHNRYSTMEAELLHNTGSQKIEFKTLLDKDPSNRRRTIKAIVYKTPGRPILMFFLLYFLRGGFMDGLAGLKYCILRSFYEFMIDCKVTEQRLRDLNRPL